MLEHSVPFCPAHLHNHCHFEQINDDDDDDVPMNSGLHEVYFTPDDISVGGNVEFLLDLGAVSPLSPVVCHLCYTTLSPSVFVCLSECVSNYLISHRSMCIPMAHALV